MSENSKSPSHRRPLSSSPASSASLGDPAYGMSPSTSSHHFSGGPSTPDSDKYARRPSTPEEPSRGKKQKKNVSFSSEADYCHDSPTLGTAWLPNPSKGSLHADRETAYWVPSSHPQATYAGIDYNPPESPTPAPSRNSDHPRAQYQASSQSPHTSPFSISSYSNNASTSNLKLPPTPIPNQNTQLPDFHTPISKAHPLATSPLSTPSSLSKQTHISQVPQQSTSPHKDVELDRLLCFRSPHPFVSFDIRDHYRDIRFNRGDGSFTQDLADTPVFSPPQRSINLRVPATTGAYIWTFAGEKGTDGDESRSLTVGFLLHSLCKLLQRSCTPSPDALSDATAAFEKRIDRVREFHPARYEEELRKGLKRVDTLGKSFTWLGLQPSKDFLNGEVVWDLRLDYDGR